MPKVVDELKQVRYGSLTNHGETTMKDAVTPSAAVDALAVIRRAVLRIRDPGNVHGNRRISESYADDLEAAADAIAELVAKANAVLSHNPAHCDTDEEADLRAALNRLGGAK